MQPIFDDAWRLRALQGNPSAVQAMLHEVLQPLYGFCLYRVGKNQHWCEEVVQETLLRALRDLASYDPPRARNNVFPWLTGLARNEIQRVLQREKATVSLQSLWAKMDQELLNVYARLESEPFDDAHVAVAGPLSANTRGEVRRGEIAARDGGAVAAIGESARIATGARSQGVPRNLPGAVAPPASRSVLIDLFSARAPPPGIAALIPGLD